MLKRKCESYQGKRSLHSFVLLWEIQNIVGDEEGVGGNCVAQALGLNIIKAR